MKAEIISIGDELLIGQVINTNTAKIGELLNLEGIKVTRSTMIQDDKLEITQAIKKAISESELVLITGGLGPTKDDITKKTIAEFFGVPLVMNEEALQNVKGFFEKRGRELTELNRKQAEVPANCLVIQNKNGTAPGMWFEEKGCILISMPGVPFEMIAMMEEFILPKLRAEKKLPFIYHKTILTQGIGESFLAEKIENWEDSLAALNIKLAYLPSPGMVRLRLTGTGNEKTKVIENVELKISEIFPQLEKYVYGFEEYGKPLPKIEGILGELLLSHKKTIALAESCTGGYISHLLTSIAGSSVYFNGTVIPYHNQFKEDILGVRSETLEKYGAVSSECVEEMSVAVLNKFGSDYAIAVSGIAGPSGGSDEKPVGTVWIAWRNNHRCISEKFIFGNDRGRNIHMTAITALNRMRRLITEGF